MIAKLATTVLAGLTIFIGSSTWAIAQPNALRDAATPAAGLQQSVIDAIARAEPSVVAISRSTAAEAQGEQGIDVFGGLREPANTNASSKVVASGVIIDPAGLVLTQYLAVREGDVHTVTTADRKTYPAKIRAADPRSGLAVLEISGGPIPRAGEPLKSQPADAFPAIKIAEADNLRKGEFVIAIGNPFAIEADGQPTASWGIITNIARKAPLGTNLNDAPGPNKDYRTTLHHLGTLLQADAKLGWSTGGGALVNLRGELIGITTTAAAIAGHEQPAGYAIPMNATIRRAVDTLKQGREVEYGMLGVGFGPPTPFSAPMNRLPLNVAQVYPNGPAARAGLQIGDVITRVGDSPVRDIDDVQLAVSAFAPGATTTVAYERGGQAATAEVSLAKLAVAGKTVAAVRPDSWRGMRVDYATTLEAPALTEAFNSKALDAEGCVLVTEVEPDSVSWRTGVRPGMFVSHVAGKRVSSPQEFQEAVKGLGEKFDLQFTTPLSPEIPKETKTDNRE